MDSIPQRAPKPSSNFSGAFLRFSKLCKLGPTGVGIAASAEKNPYPKATHDTATEGGSSGEAERIHPEVSSEEAVVLRLFESISALKAAYIQLQQAHIPYEPKKIRAADEQITSQLESLAELELLSQPRSQSSLWLEIQEHEELLQELQSKIRAKELEVIRLRREVEELNRKNAELEEEIKQREPAKEQTLLLKKAWTPTVFSDIFRLTSKSIHDFTKLLIGLMKASAWDLDRAAGAIDSSVVYAERYQKKFAFEAYLSHIMLESYQVDCFKIDHFDRVMGFSDPFDALMDAPDSDFGRFCRSKYVVAVKAKMEGSFFGNLDQRAFVLRGGHPRMPFYQAFVRMARWVWALQVMAHSFIPRAEVFYAGRGVKYSEECMESVVKVVKAEGAERLEVGFTMMPGFKIGSNVIRCRVYLCN